MNSHEIVQDLPASVLRELEIREWREDEAAAYRALLDKRQYLGAPEPRCGRLGQVVEHAGARWRPCSRGKPVDDIEPGLIEDKWVSARSAQPL
ncbi:MAG: hypothetical protein JJT96_05730 [Opitutales bacterium]|nr:hypothetical protein [Opitutales bacterium]